MEIKKQYNGESYDFAFRKDNKILEILFARNLDLYFRVREKDVLLGEVNRTIDFDITKEDYEIYSIFDSLYREIISGKLFDEYEGMYNYDYKRSDAYGMLVDRNKNINWISDDGPTDVEDRLKISKLNKDVYRLSFIRNDKPLDFAFKSAHSIVIRFRNSGSLYTPFNVAFMRLYQRLQNIDPNYHQIHIEEYEYLKKLKKKK